MFFLYQQGCCQEATIVKKVDMGIENADATILFRDKASGIVNYK